MNISRLRPAFRIAFIYAVISILWIWFSDRLIGSFFELECQSVTLMQTAKGWLFVVITSGVIYWLVSRQLLALGKTEDELRKARNDLQRFNAELEQRVSERTEQLAASEARLAESNRALSAANERLQEIDRLKSMFIASMSHELRTPLNSIIGFSGVLIEGMAGPLNPRQQDYLQRVYVSGKHLLALISDVIDISKIEAGRIEPSVSTFSLDDVVQESLDLIRLEAEKKGLSIVAQTPSRIDLHTDRKRLLQCLLNYLSNGVKYTESGAIELRAWAEDDQVIFQVSDNGIGIDESDQSKLFRAFSRIDSPLNRRVPGTGLGLYLTKKLATEVLNGTVDVTSQSGAGSNFFLRIPRNRLTGEENFQAGMATE